MERVRVTDVVVANGLALANRLAVKTQTVVAGKEFHDPDGFGNSHAREREHTCRGGPGAAGGPPVRHEAVDLGATPNRRVEIHTVFVNSPPDLHPYLQY